MSIDWTGSMQQTYEFYKVDPANWKESELITHIDSCTISRDLGVDTLGSANFICEEDPGEVYVRVYLIVTQDKIQEKICLGTFLTQTSSSKFDGRRKTINVDGYTPLFELKNNPIDVGYSTLKNTNIMRLAYELCVDHMRAPVVETASDKTLFDHMISNVDDSWFTYINDLVAKADYSIGLEPDGTVIFQPFIELKSMRPVWEFNDDNSSILFSDVTDDRDLYGIPNVVEVVYSNDRLCVVAKAVNDDPNSITSTVSRGRIVTYRDTNPNVVGLESEESIQGYLNEYAQRLLETKSTLEHTITYSHGYCPVRIGDCVLLNYERAGLKNIRVKVTQQSINCTTGCQVEETAVYTQQLWR